MIVRLAIADSNKSYIDRLVLELEKKDELVISIYTEKENMSSLISQEMPDVVLISPELFDADMVFPQGTLPILFIDDMNNIQGDFANYKCISKFQRISKIYKKVLEFYSEVCGSLTMSSGNGTARIFAFFSPVGGVGKTTVSLAAATKLARVGRRVFYLNMEDFASESCFLKQDAEHGMSEIMECLGTSSNFKMRMQSYLQQNEDGLYYLNHFSSPNDIKALEPAEIEKLLNEIRDTEFFDYIFVDMGVMLDEKNLKLLECAERIVMVEKADDIAKQKMQSFYSQTYIMNRFAKKMVRVMNMNNGLHGGIINSTLFVAGIHVLPEATAKQKIIKMSKDNSTDFIFELAN